MHEFSVCIALMEQVESIAREHRAHRVDRIVLQLGPLSGVEAQLLEHAWPLAAAGTIAAAAALVIETAPVRVKCTRCGCVSEARPNRLLCADCGDYRTQLVSGDELLLVNLELAQIEKQQLQSSCAWSHQ
jgi:hydrogenase nickel incorporation protein HypA/HybF